MNDHELRELVNQLRDIAIEYHGTQQLRERIARTVRTAMHQAGNHTEQLLDMVDHSGDATKKVGRSPVIPDGYRLQPISEYEAMRATVNSDEWPQRWIPVSERMPEMGERQCYVLAADFKNHYWPNIPNTQVGVYGDWFSDGNPTWDDGDGEDLHLKEVTHWMPLPAPPTEVK